MKVAVNTLVVIILGIVMVTSGFYFLYTITTNAESSVERVSQSEREQVLNAFPANQELYLGDETVRPENGAATIVFGVYNRYDSNLSLSYTVTCESCSSPALQVATIPTTLASGDRRVLQAQISNESEWSSGQHVLSLNVSNQSGSPVLGKETFRVIG